MSTPTRAQAFSFEYVIQHNYDAQTRAGFFSGAWHGLIAPYSLVVNLFNPQVQMYAYENTGWFYNFGFLLGVTGCLPFGWLAAIIALIALL